MAIKLQTIEQAHSTQEDVKNQIDCQIWRNKANVFKIKSIQLKDDWW